MSANENIYGLMAEFSNNERIFTAAKSAYEHGFRKMDAFTPFPVDGFSETLGQKKSLVPLIVLICGITAASAATSWSGMRWP